MNRNTKQAKKRGLTNSDELTIGTGAGRTIGTRHAEEIFKGSCCNTARPKGKRLWIGALAAEKLLGMGKNAE